MKKSMIFCSFFSHILSTNKQKTEIKTTEMKNTEFCQKIEIKYFILSFICQYLLNKLKIAILFLSISVMFKEAIRAIKNAFWPFLKTSTRFSRVFSFFQKKNQKLFKKKNDFWKKIALRAQKKRFLEKKSFSSVFVLFLQKPHFFCFLKANAYSYFSYVCQ